MKYVRLIMRIGMYKYHCIYTYAHINVSYIVSIHSQYIHTSQIITNYNNNLLNLFYLDGRVRVIRG